MKWTRKISLHFFHSFTQKRLLRYCHGQRWWCFAHCAYLWRLCPSSGDLAIGSLVRRYGLRNRACPMDSKSLVGFFFSSTKFISFELPLSDSDALKFCSSLPSLARNRAESTRWNPRSAILLSERISTPMMVSLFVLHKFAFFLTNDNINIIFGKGELDVADQNWMLRTVRNLWRKIIGFFKIVFFKNIFDSEKKSGIFGIFGSSKFLP